MSTQSRIVTLIPDCNVMVDSYSYQWRLYIIILYNIVFIFIYNYYDDFLRRDSTGGSKSRNPELQTGLQTWVWNLGCRPQAFRRGSVACVVNCLYRIMFTFCFQSVTTTVAHWVVATQPVGNGHHCISVADENHVQSKRRRRTRGLLNWSSHREPRVWPPQYDSNWPNNFLPSSCVNVGTFFVHARHIGMCLTSREAAESDAESSYTSVTAKILKPLVCVNLLF